MLEAYPPLSPGRRVGLSLIIILILVDIVFLVLLLRLPITLLSFFLALFLFVSVPVLILITFLTKGLSSARYRVQDHTLIIEWGRLCQLIGFGQIQGLYFGEELKSVDRFRGLSWPGLMVGQAQVSFGDETAEEKGPLETTFYASRKLPELLFVVTGSAAYAISPEDPVDFKICLEALRPNKETDQLPMDLSSELSFLGWALWYDRVWSISLGLAVLLNGLLFGFLSGILGRLPPEVALHFDAFAQVDRFGSPISFLIMPFIGLITWITAGVLGWIFYQVRNEKSMAYIVSGAALVIEVATWIAIIGLIRGT